jgi:hypothetical protein
MIDHRSTSILIVVGLLIDLQYKLCELLTTTTTTKIHAAAAAATKLWMS